MREMHIKSREPTRDIKVRERGIDAYLFFGVFDTSCDLDFARECLVFCSIDLVLSEHRKRSFDAELLDSDFAGRHRAGVMKVGRKPAENPQKNSIKS